MDIPTTFFSHKKSTLMQTYVQITHTYTHTISLLPAKTATKKKRNRWRLGKVRARRKTNLSQK